MPPSSFLSGTCRLRAMAMTLHYLDFDYSEDDAGCGTWDAMASVRPAQLDALLSEVAQVLAWAHSEFSDQQGPLDDGGEWDYDQQGVQEAGRYTLTLTISGTPAFGAAWRAQFGGD